MIRFLLWWICAAALPAAVHVRVGIASDGGRNGAIVEGMAPDAPGVEDAVARLLDCPVERSFGGFRCRERTLVNGLEFSGRLAFTAPLVPAFVTVVLPASPLSSVAGLAKMQPGWWATRAEYHGEIAEPKQLDYALGFSWPILLTDMFALPFLLYWIVRWPEPRWGLAAAISVWLLWLAGTGTLFVDGFFWFVPSVEGAFLRWITWVPLCLLILAQARWMRMPLAPGVWLPIAVLVLLRPRAAFWMSTGEQVLSALVSLALLALVIGPMVLRGRDGAPLPDELLVALRRRGFATGEYDIRLDEPADGSSAGRARLGRMVVIPAEWLRQSKGEALETAVMRQCVRSRFAPMAAALGILVGAWVLASLPMQRLPWLVALVPWIACAGFTLLERRWDRQVREAVR